MQPLSARDRSAQILAPSWRFEAPSWADRYAAAVRVVSLASIIGEIEAREGVNAVRLVGVDGPSGSGKSTLARRLSDRLAAPVVEIDGFLSWGDLEGWWPRFEAEVVGPLLAGRDTSFRVRDLSGDEFGSGLNGWKNGEVGIRRSCWKG
jgi:hypothetical protein